MYRHVLLVTDLGDDTDLVASRAKWLLDASPSCQLTVLHIAEEAMMGFGYELISTSTLSDKIDHEKSELARTRLAQILSRNNLHVHNVKIKIAISGRQGIIDYCQAHTVDLVIIGRHKRTGLLSWLQGATADSILPNVSADILIVPLG